jgi:hypothetical protein
MRKKSFKSYELLIDYSNVALGVLKRYSKAEFTHHISQIALKMTQIETSRT